MYQKPCHRIVFTYVNNKTQIRTDFDEWKLFWIAVEGENKHKVQIWNVNYVKCSSTYFILFDNHCFTLE